MTLDEEIKEQAKKIYEESEEKLKERYKSGKVETDFLDSYVQLYHIYDQVSGFEEEVKQFMEPQINEVVSEVYKNAEKQGHKPPEIKGNAYEKAEALIKWVVEKSIIP